MICVEGRVCCSRMSSLLPVRVKVYMQDALKGIVVLWCTPCHSSRERNDIRSPVLTSEVC